jgi:hypothetical protein
LPLELSNYAGVSFEPRFGWIWLSRNRCPPLEVALMC